MVLITDIDADERGAAAEQVGACMITIRRAIRRRVERNGQPMRPVVPKIACAGRDELVLQVPTEVLLEAMIDVRRRAYVGQLTAPMGRFAAEDELDVLTGSTRHPSPRRRRTGPVPDVHRIAAKLNTPIIDRSSPIAPSRTSFLARHHCARAHQKASRTFAPVRS